jgi:hypothetical protein
MQPDSGQGATRFRSGCNPIQVGVQKGRVSKPKIAISGLGPGKNRVGIANPKSRISLRVILVQGIDPLENN